MEGGHVVYSCCDRSSMRVIEKDRTEWLYFLNQIVRDVVIILSSGTLQLMNRTNDSSFCHVGCLDDYLLPFYPFHCLFQIQLKSL